MEELFYELLQVSVGQLDCLSRGPSPEEWLELYKTAQRQAVSGVCYKGVEHLFEFGLRAPQDVSIDWMAETEDVRQANIVVDKRCLTVQKKLTERKIYSTILLGQHAARYYGSELQELRQPDGVDLYVDCGREKAVKFVKQTGQTTVRHEHQIVFLDTWEDTAVRIHSQIAHHKNPWKNEAVSRWFRQNREQLFVEEGDVVIPSAAMDLIYVLQHLYGQFFRQGIDMRMLMDCYFILTKIEGKFATFKNGWTVEKVMKAFGMLSFVRGVMWVMQTVFKLDRSLMPCDPLESEGRFILQEVMEGRHLLQLVKHYPLQMVWNIV